MPANEADACLQTARVVDLCVCLDRQGEKLLRRLRDEPVRTSSRSLKKGQATAGGWPWSFPCPAPPFTEIQEARLKKDWVRPCKCPLQAVTAAPRSKAEEGQGQAKAKLD